MSNDDDNDALLSLHNTLSGMCEALLAFVDCAESAMAPAAILIDAAKWFIVEVQRYVNGVRFDGSH